MSPSQSVDLLLDPEGEHSVRTVWEALAAADLPSLARHRSASNRPHLTLATAPSVGAGQERTLDGVARRLPLVTAWGGLETLGHGAVAVVRTLEVTPDLRALQGVVAGALAVPDDDLTHPSRWLAHVTLAARVPEEAVERVLAVASGVSPGPVRWTRLRRWDPARRAVRDVPGDWVDVPPSGYGAPMTGIRKGTPVSWNTPQGSTQGKTVEKRTSDFTFDDQQFRASDDDPYWIVESDKSRARAAHKESSLTAE